MKRKLAVLLLLAISSLASAQLKSLAIGSLIYIGEGSDGTSFFALHIGETRFARPIPLASPITFAPGTSSFAIVGATGSAGPSPLVGLNGGPFSTPTEFLLNTLNVQQGGHPCPCLVAAVQLVMSATEPIVTITLKNGQSITTVFNRQRLSGSAARFERDSVTAVQAHCRVCAAIGT